MYSSYMPLADGRTPGKKSCDSKYDSLGPRCDEEYHGTRVVIMAKHLL